MTLDKNASFMSRALSLSTKGHPSPNPYVGAVIVKNGRIIGEGYHHAAGLDHAEVEAIKDVKQKHGKKKARELLENSTVYVTLEPCSHFGRKPPCTNAIIREKIGCVIFAMKDPNKKVKGNGEKILREKGVRIEKGLLSSAAAQINRSFIKRCQTGMPYVTLKMAMRADGSVKRKKGTARWISGPVSRHMAHILRDKSGAILVGAGTVLADNPRLTTRLGSNKTAHDPLRVIVDSELKVPLGAKVFADKNVMVAVGKKADGRKVRALRSKGIEVVVFPLAAKGRVLLRPLLSFLSKKGIDRVLCEGGPALARSLAKERRVDELMLFVAPGDKMASRARSLDPDGAFLFGLAKKIGLKSWASAGKDLLLVSRKKG